MTTTTAEITGPAAGAVERGLLDAGVDVTAPLRFDIVAGGRSNLTYRVTDAAGRRWILRRPPLSTLISSAHDVGREYRIMGALRDSSVPVPRMVHYCADPGPLGAPYFVMDFVDGTVLVDRSTAEHALTPVGRRAVAGLAIVDLLADLHAVVPASVGLGDLGRGHGYVDRQLKLWDRQLTSLDHPIKPMLRELGERLRASQPEQAELTIAHGDFRPGNIIVGPDGAVRALLDWELCTIGDPLTDLGWLLAYWGARPPVAEVFDAPTLAAGFPLPAEVLQRYASRTGREVGHVDYYVTFALWRLAVILAGVQARAYRGAYGDAPPDPRLNDRIAAVIEAAYR